MSRRSSSPIPRRKTRHALAHERTTKRARSRLAGGGPVAKRLLLPIRARSRARANLRGAMLRLPSPRHRVGALPPRLTLPSDVLGVAAVFGGSLGTVLISIVLGLVGPSWIVAVTMLGCGAALALCIAARAKSEGPASPHGAPALRRRWAFDLKPEA